MQMTVEISARLQLALRSTYKTFKQVKPRRPVHFCTNIPLRNRKVLFVPTVYQTPGFISDRLLLQVAEKLRSEA